MVASIALALQAFESGFLMGAVGFRRRRQAKVRARLIWGQAAPKTLPLLDKKLAAQTQTPTWMQARVSRSLVSGIRWVTQTRAFELLMLQMVQRRLLKTKRFDTQVSLCL